MAATAKQWRSNGDDEISVNNNPAHARSIRANRHRWRFLNGPSAPPFLSGWLSSMAHTASVGPVCRVSAEQDVRTVYADRMLENARYSSMSRVTLNEQSQAVWQSQNLEHLRYEYDLKPDDLVIDIGAYRGEWATEIYQRYGCKLICVEPGPWIVGFEHGEVINKAASDHDGKLKFGGAYYYSSSYEDSTHEYECFDINSLLSKYDEIALVKMNVEAAEYDLLEHVYRSNALKRIRDLQVQFHLIEGEDSEARYEAIAASLSGSHELQWRWPFCWENWRRHGM